MTRKPEHTKQHFELTCSANKIHIEISCDDRRRQLPEEQFQHPSHHVYTVLL